MTNGNGGRLNGASDWATKVGQGTAVVILSMLIAWVTNETIKNKVSRESGPRFTAFDAEQFAAPYDERVHNLENRMNAMEQRELPPRWLTDRVNNNALELRRQQQMMDRAESAIFANRRKPDLKPYAPYAPGEH